MIKSLASGLILSFTLLSLQMQAQRPEKDWCGFDDHYHAQMQDPIHQQQMEETERLIQRLVTEQQLQNEDAQAKTSNLVIIPVVFHVVYATEQDNISVRQIEDGLRVMNEDFRKLNADASTVRSIFQNDAADIEIEFRLAKRAPDGSCTDGITRTKSNLSLSGTNSVKDLINWDNDRYYNIWITRHVANTTPGNGGYVLGYSSFPRSGGQSYRNDGTVMRHDQLGTIGTSVADGRTLTHETGHYLALFHTFQGGCFGSGDQVADTPPVDEANFGCPTGRNSCTNDNPDRPDQIENYMDYTNCMRMFTNGQRQRMRAVINSSQLRGNLISNGNLAFTGITNPPPCAPEAKVEFDSRIVCVNEPLQLYDISEEGDADQWLWSTPGATNPSSSQQNPVVSYPRPGVYSISLEASNSAGSDSIRYNDWVYVKQSDQPFFTPTWTESFENSYIPFTTSILDGGDNNTFEITNRAASHGNQSLILHAAPTGVGETDEIVSPALQTENFSNLNLFFDFAFANRNPDNDDLLEVFASRDCGQTWIRRRSYRNFRLITAGLQGGNFSPSASEWSTEQIPFDAYIQEDPILIKFVYTNGGGNNLYIDNIRFGEGTDVGLLERTGPQIELYPNPAQNFVALKLSEVRDRQLEVNISDLSGKQLLRQALESDAGKIDTRLQLDLSPGVYLLKLEGAETQYSQKLIIE